MSIPYFNIKFKKANLCFSVKDETIILWESNREFKHSLNGEAA
jgi:hypothetical protein